MPEQFHFAVREAQAKARNSSLPAGSPHVCAICPAEAVCPSWNLPVAEIRPLWNLPVAESAHRENKNRGIFATFLRLRTLFRNRKVETSHYTTDLPAFLHLNS
jgi:hypothetical protein